MATDASPSGAERSETHERQRYQRLGEALLTHDGRIGSTPQAKTIAIEALARRMRSSTPELVLAAMGLVVGNDMAGRLGDGSYVLVAHDERYPSMGADVLHGDELRSDKYQSSAERAVRMDTDEAERRVRMIATSELMSAWSYGSNNNARVLALQEITREEFGLRGVLGWKVDRRTQRATTLELKYNRNALTDFLRTQHAMTQEVLRGRGITELLSYRALSWAGGKEQPSWAGRSVGAVVEAPQRPLSSWSADRQVVVDWLTKRGEHGVVLVARHSAQDIVSLPITGMGFLDQKEWVTLPGDQRAVIDAVVPGRPRRERAQSATPARGPDGPASATENAEPAPGPGWQPQTVAARVSAPGALDVRIGRILDGAEDVPSWWPRDDSGYSIAQRDLEFLRIDPQHLRWMLTGQSPIGLTPRLYKQFAGELGDALEQDRVAGTQADVRLKGSAAGFFSGLHKTLPTEAELSGRPEALERIREWFDGDENRPLRRPYDAMYRLGLEREPSDYDLDINSTTAVRAARAYWRDQQGDRYPGDFMGGHGYLDKHAVRGALPNLAEWAARWEDRLGRPLSLGVFESTGPFDEAAIGRRLSEHFKDSDWIIHRGQKFAGPNAPRLQRPPAAAQPDHLRRASAGIHRSKDRDGRR
ncbi:hypothetical protein ACQPYH_33195 [Kribbella sp. CA-245084]|uniref:hypothetical protein n=1 Tax=Kribbella sp. CA-245084 TaxID=3239940 RepID=UPI003D8DA1C8